MQLAKHIKDLGTLQASNNMSTIYTTHVCSLFGGRNGITIGSRRVLENEGGQLVTLVNQTSVATGLAALHNATFS